MAEAPDFNTPGSSDKSTVTDNASPLISVIVPVYNTEKYIAECLDSLLAQTLGDFEVICVNDCSPDNVMDIIRQYAARDSRIKYIDKAVNQGPMKARQDAIDIAQGRYLNFVDSDDTLPADAFECLYSRLIETGAKMAVGDLALVNPKGVVVRRHRASKIGNDWRSYLKFTLHWGSPSLCGILFDRNLLTDIKLTSDDGMILSEDRLVLYEVLIYNKPRITEVDKVVYYYRSNPSSTTRQTPSEAICRTQFQALEKASELVCKHAPELSTDNDIHLLRYLSFYIEKGIDPKFLKQLRPHYLHLLKFATIKRLTGTRFAVHTTLLMKMPGYRPLMAYLRSVIRRLQGKD